MSNKSAKTLKHQRLIELKQKKLELLRAKGRYQSDNLIEFFNNSLEPLLDGTFLKANPKQQILLDAWKNPLYKVFTFTGANRIGKCLTYNTLIETPDGDVSIGELYDIGKPFNVYSWDGTNKVIANASAPFKKSGLHKCYRIEMDDGRWIEAADYHRILTEGGDFFSIEDLIHTCFQNLPLTNSGLSPLGQILNDRYSLQKQLDCRDRCFVDCRQYDAQLQTASSSDPFSSPLQGDVPQQFENESCLDAQGNRYSNSYQQAAAPPSILDAQDQSEDQSVESKCCSFCKSGKHADPHNQFAFQPNQAFYPLPRPNCEFSQSANRVFCTDRNHDFSKCSPFYTGDNKIKYINSIVSGQEVYDFEVEDYHNYLAGGLVHHNTTISSGIIGISTIIGYWPWDKVPLWFPHKKPRKVRIIGQDWEKHISAVVVPELWKWWPKKRPMVGGKPKKNNVGVEYLWIDAETGSSIEIMSNKQDSDLHEGWNGDLIIYDEPPKRNIRVANARGLVDRQGRELFAMTLLKEAWVDQDVIKARLEDGRPDQTVFNIIAKIEDNVGFGITQEGVDQFAKTLSAEEKEARLMGIPSYMSGLVYPQFKRDTHLKKRFPVPLDWPVDVALDTHPRKPHSVLFMAVAPNGYKYCIHEIRQPGDGKQIAEAVVKILNWGSYRVNRVIIDPLSKGDPNSDEQEKTTYNKAFEVFSRYDILLETASKNKDAGILEVKNHLLGPNNEPSLFFFDDLIHTIKEMESLMWEKTDLADVEKASKVDDDMAEDLYRLILLDTVYTEIEDYCIDEQPESTKNAVTAY